MKGKKISIESIELSIRKSKMRENAGGNQNGGKNQGHEFVAEAESKASTSETGTRIDDTGRREGRGDGRGEKKGISSTRFVIKLLHTLKSSLKRGWRTQKNKRRRCIRRWWL